MINRKMWLQLIWGWYPDLWLAGLGKPQISSAIEVGLWAKLCCS